MRRTLRWVIIVVLTMMVPGCTGPASNRPNPTAQAIRYEIAANVPGQVVAVRLALPNGEVCGPCGDPSIPEEGFRMQKTYRGEAWVEATLATGEVCTLAWDGKCCMLASSIEPVFFKDCS